MSTPIQLINEFKKLTAKDQLFILHAGLDGLFQQIEAARRSVPPLYMQARLLQITDLYPMPNLVIEEKTGKINRDQLEAWLKDKPHNHYAVTIIDSSLTINKRIMVWFISKTVYFPVFEIRYTDGHDESGVGSWFMNGIQRILTDYSDPHSEKLVQKIKVKLDKNGIQEIFRFRGDSKIYDDPGFKGNCWHRIRDKIAHYNNVNEQKLKMEFGENKFPLFFEYMNSNRPSNGLIINVADSDICIIKTSGDEVLYPNG